MGRVISTCLQFIDAFSNPSKETLKSMQKLAREAKATGKSIQSAGKTIQSAGKSMTTSITAPIAGIAVTAVKTAADFEAAMTEVKVVAGASAKEFQALNEEAKRLGATTKFSAQESAEAMQYMAQAGWDTQAILDGTAGVMNAAASSGEELSTVAGILSKNITAFGDTAKDAGMYADVMSAAAAVSAADISYLGESFKYCAATAGSMGYSVQDMSVALAALSQSGIEAGTAGASLRNIIANMAKPTDSQAAVMKKLGLSLVDSKGQAKTFATVMNELRESFAGLTKKEKASAAATLAGKQSMAALQALVNTSEKDFKNFTKAINNSTGTAKEMAEEMQNNLSTQLVLLKSGIEATAITIGEKLLPQVRAAVEWTRKMFEWVNSLSSAQVSSIMKWAGIAAAIGPAVMIFGKIVTVVGVVVSKFGVFAAAVAKAGGILPLLTSPAGVVIGVLAGVAAAAVLVVKNWDKIKPVVMNVKQWFVDTFGSTVKKAIDGFKVAFRTAMDIVVGMAPSVMQGLRNAFQMVSPAITAIISAFRTALPTAINIVKGVINTMVPIFQTIITTVARLLPKAFEAARMAFTAIVPIIKNVVQVITTIAPIIASTFVSVAQKLSPVVKAIASTVKAAIPILGKMWGYAFTFVGETIAKLAPAVSKIAKAIGGTLIYAVKQVAPVIKKMASTFSLVFTTVHRVVSGAITKMQPAFNVIGTIIKVIMAVVQKRVVATFTMIAHVIASAASSIKGTIKSIKKVFNGILDFITGVFTGNWSKAWQGVKDIFAGAFEGLGGIIKAPLNAAINLINGAIAGINTIKVDIPEGVPGVGGKHFGIDIPMIPTLAKGTTNWKGGIVQISEKGGEIVDLPRGARVYPHDESVNMARRASNKDLSTANNRIARLERKEAKTSKATPSITIQKLAEKIIVREEQDIDKIADRMATKLRDTALNMGEVDA